METFCSDRSAIVASSNKRPKNCDLERECRKWLASATLPHALTETCLTLSQLKSIFDNSGLRTTIVRSPREALSIYIDSFGAVDPNAEHKLTREYLAIMFGCHPKQDQLEQIYSASWKELYCLYGFCDIIERKLPVDNGTGDSPETTELRMALNAAREFCVTGILDDTSLGDCKQSTLQRLHSIFELTLAAESRWRRDQLEYEFDKTLALNSTLGNALLQKFTCHHRLHITDVYFKRSHLPQYQRLSIYLYDNDIDEFKPPPLTLLPCTKWHMGPEHLATKMTELFWEELLQRGYYASISLRESITPNLAKYFLSGLSQNPNVPLRV